MSVLHGPMRGPMGGFMVGGARSASGGGASTLLVGDETVLTNASVDLNDGYAIFYQFTASSSGTAAKAYARMLGSFGSINAKFVIWNGSTGAVIAASAPVSVPDTAGLIEFTISASIASGTAYRIGVVCDGYCKVYTTAATWELGYEANNYATPATVTSSGGDAAYGIPEFYVKS